MIKNNFFELFELASYAAVNDSLHRDGAYTFRRICREYSRMFHTPLHEVMEMDIPHVLQMVMEGRLDDQEEDQLQQLAQQILRSPEEIANDEIGMEGLIRQFEAEEKAKQEAKSKLKESKKTEEKQQLEQEVVMDFSDRDDL